MTTPATPTPPGRTGSKTIIYVLVGLGLLTVGCGFVGMLAAIAIPSFVEMQYRAKRSEVPNLVDDIRAAQLAYHARTGRYLACGSEEAAVAVLANGNGKKRRPFSGGDGDCWAELGWVPNHEVRGEYFVLLNNDGSDFQAHGICDVDGDGEFALYVASKTTAATPVPDSTTY